MKMILPMNAFLGRNREADVKYALQVLLSPAQLPRSAQTYGLVLPQLLIPLSRPAAACHSEWNSQKQNRVLQPASTWPGRSICAIVECHCSIAVYHMHRSCWFPTA